MFVVLMHKVTEIWSE